MKSTVVLFLLIIFFASCEHEYTPKPRGYFRLALPPKAYTLYDTSGCPFSFEYPVYARVVPDTDGRAEPCWINVTFPSMKGTIHISYKNVHHDLPRFLEDSRTLAYKHTVKADAINEQRIAKPGQHVYGIMYEIEGNAASPVQFFVTDSVAHFLRGSLYFNVIPNSDSIAPVAEFVRGDVDHLIETFRWK